jgi:hypothetical protein
MTGPALVAVLVAVAMLAKPAGVLAAGPTPVDLGRAASFAVLAGAGISATARSAVRGDVGAYPRLAVSDLLDAASGGVVHRGDAAAQLAQADLVAAYALAAGASPTGPLPDARPGGRTLVAGVYDLAGATSALAGHLVLDGGGDRDGTWIFQSPADLETAPGSTIDLVNGAQACNVFWQVGGATTLGADSTFAGTILAAAAVTVGPGVTIDGRLLTTTGRVSMGGDTVAAPTCTALAAPLVRPAGATAPPQAATVVATSPADRQPSVLPLLAIAGLLLAAVLGEPRRGRRPAPDGPW